MSTVEGRHEKRPISPPGGRRRGDRDATGELWKLSATGLLLAVMEEAAWETERIDLRRGDRILLVTDGVTEAMNPRGEVIRRIHDALDEHCGERDQGDDITVLAFEVTGGSSAE